MSKLSSLLALALLAGTASAAPAAGTGTVALRAGTVYLVEEGVVLEGGATILVRDGKIIEVGTDVVIPPNAQVVDYGPDATLCPGLVAANSTHGMGAPSERTADPAMRAIDSFDLYSGAYVYDLSGGITTAYIAPGRGRLIGGQGAVVKLAGDDADGRVLSESAAIHGSIGRDARRVPGYWKPPVPATVDVGLGVVQQQLPRSAMGAVVALTELLATVRGADDNGEYGPNAAADLKELMQAGVPWRMGARTEAEILALLELSERERLPLIIEGADEAGDLAREIKRAGASVIVKVDVAPERGVVSYGKRPDDRWPNYEAAAKLVEAGVPIAICTGDGVSSRDLRFAAAVASRGGLDASEMLRAVTLDAAAILGVDDRVGSIAPGKDADFVVLSGPPMSSGSSVLATWVDGDLAWSLPRGKGRSGSAGAGSVVIEAQEVHLGDGRVLTPGQVLIQDGLIVEVGARVGHPAGATVVRGHAAMPGMIDAYGHLGLNGSGTVPDVDFKLTRVVEPGDFADRRVARAGVTTVVMAPRGTKKSGVPLLAYKPAGTDLERMVIADPAAVHLVWSNDKRIKSGEDVQKLLEKVMEYEEKWNDYNAAMAVWVPPAPKVDADEEDDEDKDEEDDEEAEDDKPDSKSKKKKKKKKDDDEEDEDLDRLTGVWETAITVPPYTEESDLRLRLSLTEGTVTGSLRCEQLSDRLVIMAGSYEDGALKLAGVGSRGMIGVTGAVKKGALEGAVSFGAATVEFEAERTSEVYDVARRTELRRGEKAEKVKPPKGKPKSPGIDEKLEPLRRAMRGETAVIVDVDREREIMDCVAAFEAAGIRPILFGADDAWRVADEISGRISGILLSSKVRETAPREGLESERNRYVQLAAAGIPVAFHSAAEEGAADLPLFGAFVVAQGLSPTIALRALTSDAARMMSISDRVGMLEVGLDGDVLLLDGPPLDPATRVVRTWVNGTEVR